MSTAARSPFGEVLRRLRLRAGLSQEQLAERARLSSESIGALERGARRAPYRETVELLATALAATESERDELRAASQRPRRLPGLAQSTAPAPAEPVRAVPNNLPFEATSLRGRERDLTKVRSLVEKYRLVTIAGAGGIGKTRLAIALASRMAADGGLEQIWFVELAPVASSELVAEATAKVVGVAQQSTRSFEELLVAALAKKRGLLVLDNCEHVLDAAAALAAAIRTACPLVSVVTTSRQALGLSGEAVYRLPSLDFPAELQGLRAEDALRYGAIALFVDRATLVDPSFVLDDENAPLVATVCAQLDGIALALELAAARVSVLSVAGLVKRLTERFRLLTGGDPRGLRRQRTLSALIDWSYDLLAPAERMLLNRSAIFSGGFGLDAAAAICADAGQDEFDILDLLASLVDKSLIIADTTAETERFRLLESTRAYAFERLDAFGERQRIAELHARHFAQVAAEADASYGSTKTSVWLPPLELETDNLRRALEWSLGERNDVPLGAAMAAALERFWLNGGFEVEGRRWIVLGLELLAADEHPAIEARLRRAHAWLTIGATKSASAGRAAELYARLGETAGLGDSLRLQALGEAQLGNMREAFAINRRALAIVRATGDRRNLANCLDMDGAIAAQLGDFETARTSLDEAIPLFRELGSEGGSASALTTMSQVEFLAGDAARALELARQAHRMRKSSKYSTNFAIDNISMAIYCIALHDLEAASAYALAGLEAAHRAQSGPLIVNALAARAAIAALRGDIVFAAHLSGYIKNLSASPVEHDLTEQHLYATLAESLRTQVEPGELAALEAEGAHWPQERAVREALREVGAPSA